MIVERAWGAALAAVVASCAQTGKPTPIREFGEEAAPPADSADAPLGSSSGEKAPDTDSGVDAVSRSDLGGDGGVGDSEALVPVQEFDLGLDFSFSANPNGPWRYGYTGGTALRLESSLLDSFGAGPGDGGIGFWHPSDVGGIYAPVSNPSDGGGGYYPYVACNPGPATVVYSAAWAARSHEIAMEASNAGQFSVVEFVAPQPGQYRIQAHFEGIHFRLSTTDVHVLLGDLQLWAANIDGYGGDPTFHAVVGTSPAADYGGTVTLQANDVLTFAVGYGSDDTNYNDTTGLAVHVSQLGPP